MRIFILGTLLAFSITNVMAAECAVGRNGVCSEQLAAERKAEQEARLNCIRSGQDPNKCPPYNR